MVRKVLFLDVDGVLNHNKMRGWNNVDPDMIRHLARIVRETNCEIVISSSWRLAGTFSLQRAMSDKLAKEPDGADVYSTIVGRFVGITPVLINRPRGREIQKWIEDEEFDGVIAILDDFDDMCDLLPRLVKTDGMVGLTAVKADQVIAMLNAEPAERSQSPAPPSESADPVE